MASQQYVYVYAHVHLGSLLWIFFSQILQWNDFFSLCVRPCSFKFPFWENPFLQNLHWNGLSPVCVRSWPVR